MIKPIGRGVLDTPLSRGTTNQTSGTRLPNSFYCATSFLIAALIGEAASS